MENSISNIYYSSIVFNKSQNNNPINMKINKTIKLNSKLIPKLIIPKNNSASNIFLNNSAFTSLGKKNVPIKNMYNRLTPLCIRNKKKKYGNFYIFGKREIIFRKIMKQGKKVFRYNQSLRMEKNNKSRILHSNKNSNSLFLTESLAKTAKHKRKSAFPLVEKNKTMFDLDLSNIKNKNQNLSRNSLLNLSNNNNNTGDFLTNKNYNENIVRDKNGIILLNKISLNLSIKKNF